MKKSLTTIVTVLIGLTSGCSEPRPESVFKQLNQECKNIVEGTTNGLVFNHLVSPKTNAPFRSRVTDWRRHYYYQDMNLNGVADEKDFYLCTEYQTDEEEETFCDDGISECIGTNCDSCYKVLGFTYYPDSVTTDHPIPTIIGEESDSRTYSSDEMKYLPYWVLSRETVLECRKQCIDHFSQSNFITLSPEVKQEWANWKLKGKSREWSR